MVVWSQNSSENQTLLDRMQERFEANSCQITELEKKIFLLNEENSKLMNEKFVAAGEYRSMLCERKLVYLFC